MIRRVFSISSIENKFLHLCYRKYSHKLKMNMENIEISMHWGKVAGVTFGSNKNEPVLMLHGWLDNLNSFKKLQPLLKQDKFYVMIDLPGHGKSSHLPFGSFYSMFFYVDFVERIRKHFDWNTLSFLSHSLGANISAMYSATFENRVDKLIIIDTLGLHPYKIKSMPDKLRDSITKYHEFECSNRTEKLYSYEQAKQRLQEGNKDLSESSVDVLLERGLLKKGEDSYVFSRDLRHKLPNLTYISDAHAPHFVTRITAETLHILAEDGLVKRFITPETKHMVDTFLSFFKNCQHKEDFSCQGNHHVHLNHPEVICDVINKFLSRSKRSQICS